jgi:hypothetical protein
MAASSCSAHAAAEPSMRSTPRGGTQRPLQPPPAAADAGSPEFALAALDAAAGLLHGVGMALNVSQALDLARARLTLHLRTRAHATRRAAFRRDLAAAGPAARRGILIAAGGGSGAANLANAAVAVRVLTRSLNCSLPIEVVHFGRGGGFDAMASLIRSLNASAVAGQGGGPGRGGGGDARWGTGSSRGGGASSGGALVFLVDALDPRFFAAAEAATAPWTAPQGLAGGGGDGSSKGSAGEPVTFAAKVFALAFVSRFQQVRT